jgi:hypothetical protein
MKKVILASVAVLVMFAGCVNDPTLSDEVGSDTETVVDTATETVEEVVVEETATETVVDTATATE